ncbi:transglycosylase domain-containing protein [Pseudoroseomonas cervicalis]|uniref:transglycosylase domain-containing protein n=1 Tax=Teichococcus cervicalis TaxID=204525 RepID=UPI0035EF9946
MISALTVRWWASAPRPPARPQPPRRRRPAAARRARPAAAAARGGRKGGEPGKSGRGLGRLVARLAGFGLAVGLAATAVGGIAAYGFYRQATADLPEHAWLADYQPPQMSRIYAADSRLMAELALERRVFLPIGAIPRRVQQAFTAAEDQRFWEHHGVDPIGIGRAVISNIEGLASGRRAGGASTITQQVAKNMLVGNERTMLRKVREAVLAFRLEGAMPKERILEIYLNEIFLGAQAYGRRRRGDELLQQGPRRADAGRDRLPRRPAQGAQQLQPRPLPRGRQGPPRLGAGPHGR